MHRLLCAFAALFALIPQARASAPDPRPVLVVLGMATEAKIAKGPGIEIVMSAGKGDVLREKLKAFSRQNVRAVVSFGVTGGLDPAAKSGDLYVSKNVVAVGKGWSTDSGLDRQLASVATRAGVTVHRGTMVGVDFLGGTDRQAKAKLRADSGADVVDNESHVAAEFAAHEGLPFALVRSVDDVASETLPPAALIPLKPDGTPDGAAILKSLAQHPGQLGALIHLAFEEEKALATLRKVRKQLDFRALR